MVNNERSNRLNKKQETESKEKERAKQDLEWNQRTDKEGKRKDYRERIGRNQIQTHWCQQMFWGSASIKEKETKKETDYLQ